MTLWVRLCSAIAAEMRTLSIDTGAAFDWPELLGLGSACGHSVADTSSVKRTICVFLSSFIPGDCNAKRGRRIVIIPVSEFAHAIVTTASCERAENSPSICAPLRCAHACGRAELLLFKRLWHE